MAELQGNKIGALYLTGLEIDAALAPVTQNWTRSQITDALGSLVAETDAQGNVASSYAYSPYGETKVSGETDNAVRYTAREEDGTGLYYYRARYYDPRLKRFISEDPIGLVGGINAFAYVNGAPVNSKDPMGQIKGHFGPVCGPEGTDIVTWLPDITVDAGRMHGKCYDDCARACRGLSCRLRCDFALGSYVPGYGLVTSIFGGHFVYNEFLNKYHCSCKR